MTQPTLIFLNGTSSAGKTSIAKALQREMEQPYLYCSADAFTAMLPPYREGLDWVVDDILDTLRFGFYSGLAAFVAAGNYVVADHVVTRPVLMESCAAALANTRAFLVGVRCPLEIARQREIERGDRTIGLVDDQFHRVHADKVYDVEVDTSLLTAEAGARVIARYVSEHEPQAFRQLNC